MLSLFFAFAALVMFGLSYFLVRKTSAYTRTGGDAYVRRVRRKMIGLTLLFPALLLVAMAIGVHVASSPESLQAAPGAIPTEPYVPPVLPKPSEDDILASREAPMKFSATSGPVHRRASDDISTLTAATLPATSPLAPPSPSATSAPNPFATALPSAPSSAPANSAQPSPFANPMASPMTSAPASSPNTSPLSSGGSALTPDEKINDALEKLNAMIKANPNDARAYGELGNLYASRQAWTEAEINYQKSLSIDPANSNVKYNLAQMQFVQKKYDDARPGFAAMEKDPQLGDLASYKTFLCDLYGGHQDAASKELDAFNQAGENASYYFANVAWSISQKKTDDARDWLTSASHIYSPQKITLYTADLAKLGYLPLPDKQ